jgi:ribosomal protection tetracycline resistance protein
MGSARGLGTRAAGFTPWGEYHTAARARLAEILAEHDERILAAYVDDELAVPYDRLRRQLAAQTRRALVHPVFLGSAVTGAGVESLMAGLTELLPAAAGDPGGPVSGRVFKIERGAGGEKVAYPRMFSGTLRTRDRIRVGRLDGGQEGRHDGRQDGRDEKVTAIGVSERGPATPRTSVSAGDIATLRGLHDIRIGDQIGQPAAGRIKHRFAPPTFESVVLARRPADRAPLRAALGSSPSRTR